MKIQYMSDLHLEFAGMPVPEKLGDVLVLAGDIHVGDNAIAWIEQCAMKFDHVIYILGNHEYYGQKFWKLPKEIKHSIDGKDGLFTPLNNVHFLDNDTFILDDVQFIGSTLWSMALPELQYIMADFQRISYKYQGGYGKFDPITACQIHMESKWFIKSVVEAGTKNGLKNVVITHHAPSMEMVNQLRFNNKDHNTGWATDILHEFDPKDIALWISGHTHAAYDKVIHGIHSVSNCRGYEPYEPVENFNPTAMIEV